MHDLRSPKLPGKRQEDSFLLSSESLSDFFTDAAVVSPPAAVGLITPITEQAGLTEIN